MFLTLLFTLIGSSIGGLLALGTAWASIKRMMQRSLAYHLKDAIPKDRAAAIVIAGSHAGPSRTAWISNAIFNLAGATDKTTVLDIAGGTHLDLLQDLIPRVKEVHVYDGRCALDYMHEKMSLLKDKLKITEGEDLFGDFGGLVGSRSFDVVLLLDIIHTIRPELRQNAVQNWVKLVEQEKGIMIIVIEEDPLTDVSQSGVIQGIFFRISLPAIKALLAAEGMVVQEVLPFREEHRLAVIARRGSMGIKQ